MNLLLGLVLIVAAFVAGVLFGKANPDKAKIIKEYADQAKAKVVDVTKKG
jgi:hypothetical protein